MPKKLVANEAELALFAKDFVAELSHARPSIIGLTGDLGAGKTTFSQQVLAHLGVTDPVRSPTFTLVHPYEVSHEAYDVVYHIDVYRLEDPHEIFSLGLNEMIEHPRALVLCEWADRIRDALPADTRWVNIMHGAKPDAREITYEL